MLAPGTAYVIPARVGVWLVGGCPLGSDVRLRFVAAAAHKLGSVFFRVRFRGRGPRGCVLLTKIYEMSSRL